MKEERNRQGLSQQALAERAQLSLKTIKRYESGSKAMQLDVAYDIANALNIPFQYLLPFKERNVEQTLDEMEVIFSYLREQFKKQ